jgi:L-alanine-DL-glutamate epimerase-like enolase superfamily enzyme
LDAGSADRDLAVYQAVRDAVGPDYPCMADNYRTYSLDDALRVGRVLDDLGFEWLESPMPESDDWRQRYVSLAAQVRTPICAPETHPESYFARLPWITEKACDIARMDVAHGGFTACLELALACQAGGIRLELKDLGPDSYPHLQLLGATSESLIRYVELASHSQEVHTRPGRVTPEPVFDAAGYVAIPQTPGMGLELDWKYIYAHKVS